MIVPARSVKFTSANAMALPLDFKNHPLVPKLARAWQALSMVLLFVIYENMISWYYAGFEFTLNMNLGVADGLTGNIAYGTVPVISDASICL